VEDDRAPVTGASGTFGPCDRKQRGRCLGPSGTIYDARYEGEVFPGDTESQEKDLEKAAPFYDFYRPVMVSLRHCRKVLVEGVHLQNSAAWNFHPYFCEDLTVRDVDINNPYYA